MGRCNQRGVKGDKSKRSKYHRSLFLFPFSPRPRFSRLVASPLAACYSVALINARNTLGKETARSLVQSSEAFKRSPGWCVNVTSCPLASLPGDVWARHACHALHVTRNKNVYIEDNFPILVDVDMRSADLFDDKL